MANSTSVKYIVPQVDGVSWGSIEQFPRNLNKSGGKFMKGRELEKIRILV